MQYISSKFFFILISAKMSIVDFLGDIKNPYPWFWDKNRVLSLNRKLLTNCPISVKEMTAMLSVLWN